MVIGRTVPLALDARAGRAPHAEPGGGCAAVPRSGAALIIQGVSFSAGPFCFLRVDLGKRFKIHPAYIPRPATNSGGRLYLAAVRDQRRT